MDISALITQCKQEMKGKGLTNREVAQLADISESTVSRVLASDGQTASAATLEALCRALRVDEDTSTEQPPPASSALPASEAPASLPFLSPENVEHIYERRVEDLRQQVESKEHWLRITVFLCVCLIGAILLILLVDLFSPSIGWFRRGAPAGYLANTASGIYHRADCVAAASMSDAHRIGFATAQDAIEAGFHACQLCLR